MPVLNLKGFNRLVSAFTAELMPAQASLLQRAIAIEALKRLIQKTPKDTGLTTANWQLTIGRARIKRVKTPDKKGADTLVTGISALAGLKPYQIVFLVNNHPAAIVLEEGLFIPKDPGPSKDPRPDRKGRVLVKGGYSVQAPKGMVQVTIQELEAIFP